MFGKQAKNISAFVGMFEFGVVGLGIAGCVFLACLPDDRLRNTLVFDSGCLGGDLARRYGSVVANLTCEQLSNAIHAIPRWKDTRLTVLEAQDPNTCPRLSDLCKQLCELMRPLLPMTTLHSQHIASISQIPGGWVLLTAEGASYTVTKSVICTGGEPRRLDYPKPAIPLEIALDAVALDSYIRPTDRVVVFGTAHSGTLILRNLRDMGCRDIVGAYREAPPFRWVRAHTPECPCHLIGGTGCHDSEGVKQESAAIADAIVRGEWPSVRILRTEGEEFVRAVMAADYVVYATGFQRRIPVIKGLGGDVLEARHDPVTGAIAPGLWGFGLAFPGQYEKPQGGTAPDIGLPGFVAHIQACLGGLL